MQSKWTYQAGSLIAALLLVETPLLSFGVDSATKQDAAQVPPDNTGRNVRDRDENAKTADQQSNSKEDVEITRQIRRAVVEDKSLSTSAHNVKIVTVDRVVTLRGPVASTKEKAAIAAKAEKIAGVQKVENQLEVAKP
jgi:osmotically-inducible protein OsmY